ncbi:hypothetical protein [Streptacidiphilus rugosus]|nr:hypothetical protein [Streptacidiphilus rugosus]
MDAETSVDFHPLAKTPVIVTDDEDFGPCIRIRGESMALTVFCPGT